MTSFDICNFEDFVAEVTAQKGSLEEAASAQEILIQQVEGYFNRMREAICRDVQALEAQINAIVPGGGGLPDLDFGVEVSSGREINGFPSFFKMIDISPLPNTATVTFPHGIVPALPFTEFIVVHMYGQGNDRIAPSFSIPITFGTTTFNTNQVYQFTSVTNINVVAGLDRTNYTDAFSVLEYYYA